MLIRVAAAGINRPDVLQRKGQYAPPPGVSDIPGLEVAGDGCGGGRRRARTGGRERGVRAAGRRRLRRVRRGARAAVPAAAAAADLEEAAALPETFFTVWLNVFERARLRAGETLLVHGGSSGIGTTAILLGKAFGATRDRDGRERRRSARPAASWAPITPSTTTKGTSSRRRCARPTGAVRMSSSTWSGATYVARNVAAAATEGRIALIAVQGGTKAELDLRPLLTKRLMLGGSTLRPQSVEKKGRLAAGIARAGVAAVRHAKTQAPDPRALPARRCSGRAQS